MIFKRCVFQNFFWGEMLSTVGNLDSLQISTLGILLKKLLYIFIKMKVEFNNDNIVDIKDFQNFSVGVKLLFSFKRTESSGCLFHHSFC